MKIIGRGETYAVSETGQISRACLDWKYSDSWRLVGAVRFNNFGRVVERARFDGQLLQLSWMHKNGKQRWFIVDYDHGSERIWTSPTPYRIVGN